MTATDVMVMMLIMAMTIDVNDCYDYDYDNDCDYDYDYDCDCDMIMTITMTMTDYDYDNDYVNSHACASITQYSAENSFSISILTFFVLLPENFCPQVAIDQGIKCDWALCYDEPDCCVTEHNVQCFNSTIRAGK